MNYHQVAAVSKKRQKLTQRKTVLQSNEQTIYKTKCHCFNSKFILFFEATSYPGSHLRSLPRPHAHCEKTLAVAGHVAPRFWEPTKKSIGGRVRRNSLLHKNIFERNISISCAKFYTSEIVNMKWKPSRY